MKILIATGLYPPEIGGPATYAKLLEDRLPARGIAVSVFPFRTVRHLPPGLRHIAYAWGIVRMAQGADLILVQDTVSTGLPAAIAALLTGKKLVVRVPGDYAWEQGVQRFGVQESLDEFQEHSYGLRVGLFRSIQRFVVRRAHRVIAPSVYLGNIVSGWLAEPTHIEVIYNGVEIQSGEEASARRTNLIVSLGRLVPWKGFAELIDIVARHPQWRLAIRGDGPLRDQLRDQIEKNKAGAHITLDRSVSHVEAIRSCKEASVFVLNSRYEGLSHTLIEAMAVGTPVIATNVGGNPEVVRGGVDGTLVQVGDIRALENALAKLLSDAPLRARLGESAAARAKEFSIDRTVEATAKLLRSSVSVQ